MIIIATATIQAISVFLTICCFVYWGLSFLYLVCKDYKGGLPRFFAGLFGVLFFLFICYTNSHSSNWYRFKYQEKVNAVHRAEKDLELVKKNLAQFLEQHPEFEEVSK